MEQNEIFVSVVIPTHNRADCVKYAIESALNQTHKNLEVIVVSDGSTDDTDAVVNDIAKKDSRVTYLSYKPARGGNYARNLGIEASKYEYIAFLDDDDRWYANKIEKQLAVFASNPEIGLVCTGINNVHVSDNAPEYTIPFIPAPPFNAAKAILLGNCIGSTTTVMVKAELLEKSGIFDVELEAMQDYDLWIRLCQVTKVGVVSEPCVDYYHYVKNNQVSQHTQRYINSAARIKNKYAKLFQGLTDQEQKHRSFSFEFTIAKKGLRNCEPKIARKYAKSAFKISKRFDAVLIYIASFFPKKFIMFFVKKLSN